MRFIATTLVLALMINLLHAANFREYIQEIEYGIDLPKAIENRHHEDKENNGIEIKSQKIVRGNLTDIRHVPYQVGLIINGLITSKGEQQELEAYCGGSLLARTWILTAAHCLKDSNFEVSKIIAVLGSNTIKTGGVRRRVNSVAVHPLYKMKTTENDMIRFSDVIQPIALPSVFDVIRQLYYTGVTGLISGYGVTSDFDSDTNTVLNSARMKIISNKKCAKTFREGVKETNICIQGRNGASACSGDSGGPLVINRGGRNILVGVTSWGYKYCECGYPDVYTRVTSFLPWIILQSKNA